MWRKVNKHKRIKSVDELDENEITYLKMLCKGMTDEDISIELDRGEDCVRSMNDTLKRKLGGMNRVQLAVWFTKGRMR